MLRRKPANVRKDLPPRIFIAEYQRRWPAPRGNGIDGGLSCQPTSAKAVLARSHPRNDQVTGGSNTGCHEAHEGVGGKLLSYYVTFGEYDWLLIAEAPDEQAISAAVLTAAAGGGVTDLRTTVAMTPPSQAGVRKGR